MISAKVAKVLSDNELVINKGEADGVETGMIFTIKDDRLDDIVDPDTGEDLGSIDRPKISIRIMRTGKRAALGRRYEDQGTWLSILSSMQSRPRGILSNDLWGGEVEVGDPAVWEGQRVVRTF